MKKVLAILILVFFISGCNPKPKTVAPLKHSGVWLTYSEVDAMLEKGLEKEIEMLIKNCQNLKINNLYIHVRAFGDSLYKSEYFSENPKTDKYDFDVLEYIIKKCHKSNILVHAWINPYRISATSENIEEIDKENPAYIWLHDDKTENDKKGKREVS